MPNVSIRPSQDVTVPPIRAVVDGFPHMRHVLTVDTADEPLEDGTDVTDHATARGEQLKLSGMVSNMSDAAGRGPRTAMLALRAMARSLTPTTVRTPWGNYRNMILTKCDASDYGLGMRFELELKELIFVAGASSELADDSSSGPATGRSSNVDRGRIAPTP